VTVTKFGEGARSGQSGLSGIFRAPLFLAARRDIYWRTLTARVCAAWDLWQFVLGRSAPVFGSRTLRVRA